MLLPDSLPDSLPDRDDDLWVFGYGSLMWRPGFAFIDRVPARLVGLHRGLCVYSFVHRGTPHTPGLVLGLDRGGACRGIAYRVAAAQRDAVIAYLREREQVTSVYLETMRRITLSTVPPREVRALTYVVDRSHVQYAGRLPVDRQVELVRQGVGRSGKNLDYVLSTVAEIEAQGCHDLGLRAIAARLGSERRHHPHGEVAAPANPGANPGDDGRRRHAVAAHYGGDGVAARMLAAVRGAGPARPVTAAALAPFDHFHGGGAAATAATAAQLALAPGERVLDIGAGVGGPARFIAEGHDVEVTAVDLTAGFCAAAAALNAATGLTDRVHVVAGSAVALPLADAAFDAAWSHNVVMNIADKERFYREAFRVLRPGGRLALSALCAGPGGEPYFPVPWARSAGISFLQTPEAMRAGLQAAGFEIVAFRDVTAAILKAAAGGDRGAAPPAAPTALDILMGADAAAMRDNAMRTLRDDRGRAVEALVRKP